MVESGGELLALQRVRTSHRLQSVQADDSRVVALYIAGMLRALPFKTIGDIARHGLELHVYCPSCYSTRRPVDLERWADRCFAAARFRCRGTRHTGGPVTLAFLTCPRCIWEINQVQLDQPPWSGSTQHYRCPGCHGRVEWHIHGPAWRPFDNSNGSGAPTLMAK